MQASIIKITSLSWYPRFHQSVGQFFEKIHSRGARDTYFPILTSSLFACFYCIKKKTLREKNTHCLSVKLQEERKKVVKRLILVEPICSSCALNCSASFKIFLDTTIRVHHIPLTFCMKSVLLKNVFQFWSDNKNRYNEKSK